MRYWSVGTMSRRNPPVRCCGVALALTIVTASGLSTSARAADAALETTPRLELAALPVTVSPAPVAAPITPIQQQTCGCTPQGKQKIIVIISGNQVCTATTLPCTAP